jgi:hypothetical protein
MILNWCDFCCVCMCVLKLWTLVGIGDLWVPSQGGFLSGHSKKKF